MSPVRVGILHSLQGTVAISEAPLIDATLLAIAEINQTGGVLGKLIEPVIADGASHTTVFEDLARKLIKADGINNVFGCFSSIIRKAVLPIFEEYNALLWYPLQYEGLESSKNIFYTGPCPNQQVEPAVTWLLKNQGIRFYLVGSDYIFPSTVNTLIKAQLKQQGGLVVGENYLSLGANNFCEIIYKIQQAKPDVIFNTLNGDSNIAFYRQYLEAGITAQEIPILAVSITEHELQKIGNAAVGHYASWGYFQSLETPSNTKFVKKIQATYGANRVTSDPIEAAYSQVYLWKQAVELAQSFAVDQVRIAAIGSTLEAPRGLVRIEQNHHISRACRIGKILPKGQFQIVGGNDELIKPLPWLAVEELNCSSSPLVIALLAEVSKIIHKNWQLEQKYRELETEKLQLQREINQQRRVEDVLRNSEEELHTIFAAMTELILAIDINGRYLKIAPTHQALSYKNTHELIGKTLPDVFGKEQGELFLGYIKQAILNQQTVNLEYSNQTPGEKEEWFSVKISPVNENSVIWVARDITDRKQAEAAQQKAEERYRSIFENSDKGLFQTTPDGCYLSANPALAKIYGYDSPEELIEKLTNINQQLYVDEDRRAEFLAIMEAQDSVSNFESQVYRQDGKVIWILENAHVVRDAQGNALYYEGSIVDITKHKVWEEALRYQQECTEDLLLNILPTPIAERLKRAESIIADSFTEVTVLFADLVNFTEMSSQISPIKLVDLLNKIFSVFDRLSEKHGLEKIKTIGDAYMVVGGLPTPKADHAEAIAQMALDMQQEITHFQWDDGKSFSLRIGIHTGPVVAGVIGLKKFSYDLWGDTVNVASRMESQGVPGRIQVTDSTYERLKDKYLFIQRGVIEVKGKGEMISYWLVGKKNEL
jgi:urea ABC transporter urea binding protein